MKISKEILNTFFAGLVTASPISSSFAQNNGELKDGVNPQNTESTSHIIQAGECGGNQITAEDVAQAFKDEIKQKIYEESVGLRNKINTLKFHNPNAVIYLPGENISNYEFLSDTGNRVSSQESRGHSGDLSFINISNGTAYNTEFFDINLVGANLSNLGVNESTEFLVSDLRAANLDGIPLNDVTLDAIKILYSDIIGYGLEDHPQKKTFKISYSNEIIANALDDLTKDNVIYNITGKNTTLGQAISSEIAAEQLTNKNPDIAKIIVNTRREGHIKSRENSTSHDERLPLLRNEILPQIQSIARNNENKIESANDFIKHIYDISKNYDPNDKNLQHLKELTEYLERTATYGGARLMTNGQFEKLIQKVSQMLENPIIQNMISNPCGKEKFLFDLAQAHKDRNTIPEKLNNDTTIKFEKDDGTIELCNAQVKTQSTEFSDCKKFAYKLAKEKSARNSPHMSR